MGKACMSLKYAAGGIPVNLIAPTVTGCTPATGGAAGGTAITDLAGTNFRPGATVKIGGVSCTAVVVVSKTKITCVTGAHATGVVNVVVTNPDGHQTSGATGNGDFEYV